jgi:hypothetical protein
LLLERSLEGPSGRALRGLEAAVEVGLVLLLQVPADEGRVRDAFAVVVDVGELALRGFGEAPGIDLVGLPRHLQEDFCLHDERARIGQAQPRSKSIERYHMPSALAGERCGQ